MSHTDTIPMLQVILEEIRELKAGQQRLDEAVRGNGKPGLNQRVAAIEDRLKLVAGAFLLALPMAWDFLKSKLGI